MHARRRDALGRLSERAADDMKNRQGKAKWELRPNITFSMSGPENINNEIYYANHSKALTLARGSI